MPTYPLIVTKKGVQSESQVSFRADSLEAAFLSAEARGYTVVGQAPGYEPAVRGRSDHVRTSLPATVELGPESLKALSRIIGNQVASGVIVVLVLLPLAIFALFLVIGSL